MEIEGCQRCIVTWRKYSAAENTILDYAKAKFFEAVEGKKQCIKKRKR